MKRKFKVGCKKVREEKERDERMESTDKNRGRKKEEGFFFWFFFKIWSPFEAQGHVTKSITEIRNERIATQQGQRESEMTHAPSRISRIGGRPPQRDKRTHERKNG